MRAKLTDYMYDSVTYTLYTYDCATEDGTHTSEGLIWSHNTTTTYQESHNTRLYFLRKPRLVWNAIKDRSKVVSGP